MIIIIVLVIDSSCNILMPVWHTANTGGLTCHDFGYGRATENPGPRPIHILGEVKKKTRPIHIHMYFQYRKLYPFIYYFQILLIHILFGWKRYPIDILLRWKSYPFIYLDAWKSSRTSFYTFIMEVSPPPPPWLPTPPQGSGVVGISGNIYLAPPPLHGKIRGNGPGSTKVSVLTMYFVVLQGPHFPV